MTQTRRALRLPAVGAAPSSVVAPILVGEILSFRTWQQGDLARKPRIYSSIGVEEYLVADVTGEMLEQRLLLLRSQPDGTWSDEKSESASPSKKSSGNRWWFGGDSDKK